MFHPLFLKDLLNLQVRFLLYGLVDAQFNFALSKLNSVLKIGASNVLNNKVYQTYGGPRIGRMAYISYLYDFKIK